MASRDKNNTEEESIYRGNNFEELQYWNNAIVHLLHVSIS